MDEDEIFIWQDVLDEVAAGRGDGLSCPNCREGTLKVEQGNVTGRLRISCPKCLKFIEGTLPEN